MSAEQRLAERMERVRAEPYGRKSFMVRIDDLAEVLASLHAAEMRVAEVLDVLADALHEHHVMTDDVGESEWCPETSWCRRAAVLLQGADK